MLNKAKNLTMYLTLCRKRWTTW